MSSVSYYIFKNFSGKAPSIQSISPSGSQPLSFISNIAIRRCTAFLYIYAIPLVCLAPYRSTCLQGGKEVKFVNLCPLWSFWLIFFHHALLACVTFATHRKQTNSSSSSKRSSCSFWLRFFSKLKSLGISQSSIIFLGLSWKKRAHIHFQ